MSKLPSVYKRAGSPVYWGSVMINGKRKQYALCENKAAAQRMLADIKAEAKSRSKYGAMSWNAFKERYFVWAKANKDPKTVYRDKLAVEYFDSFCHITELNNITLSLLEDFKTYLKNKSKSLSVTYNPKKEKRPKGLMGNESINRSVRSLKTMFRKAAEWELMPEIRWEKVKYFKTPKGRVEFFSADELKALLKYADQVAAKHNGYCPQKTVCLLGGRAGLRRGEILHLEWSDIDFDKKIITVQPKKNWHPKDYECRDIPLSEDLFLYLKNLSYKAKSNRVLYDYYGAGYSEESLSTYFRKFTKKAGLDGGVHKLRHTFGSHLAQAGVSLKIIAELMGHSSTKTTEIYAHLCPDTLSEAITRLPKL